MPFDPERHHRRSIRLPDYDYSCGVYFVTICTFERVCLFGQVGDRGMAMNELGWIVWEEWERSGEIRAEMELGAFVVMPNHLHGIVTIKPDGAGEAGLTATRAHGRAPRQRAPKSLGAFVAGFKAAATTQINIFRGMPRTPVWQRNYYEKVIRDERMLERVWWYVETNPIRWAIDRENPDHTGTNAVEQWLCP